MQLAKNEHMKGATALQHDETPTTMSQPNGKNKKERQKA